MDREALASEAMSDAVRCLVHRAGGDGATPEGVRAVLARDGASRHPDPWQWWFREATGLKVYVSTEAVILVTRPHGPAGPAKVLRVELPEVVRKAVRTPADAVYCPDVSGCRKRREPQPGEVLAGCPACGVPRAVQRRHAARLLVRPRVCPGCVRRTGRKGAA